MHEFAKCAGFLMVGVAIGMFVQMVVEVMDRRTRSDD